MVRRSKSKPVKMAGITNIKRSTSDVIFDALREAILSRQIPGGTPLVEAQLAQQFGVSKTPVREALQRLTHSGLVDFELAKGATVHEITRDEIHDIWEMRIMLEPRALKQSAPDLTPAELQQLDQLLLHAKQALDAGNFHELSILNNAFHETLYSKASNHLLTRWLSSLNDLRRLISMHGWSMENRTSHEWEEHQAILEAVKAGDYDLAARHLEQHITRFANLLLDTHEA